MRRFRDLVQLLIGRFGYRIIPLGLQSDMDREFAAIYKKCRIYTMTSCERMYALYKAVQYIVDARIPGDLVECGIWRGGSTMVMAYVLLAKAETKRTIYLYDTFAGMPEPGPRDISSSDSEIAMKTWKKNITNTHNEWCFASLSEVRRNMLSTGYPASRIRLVKGRVEDTIPGIAPSQVALLRLDTDWYESTYHELTHLFPRLSHGGILIIDDYGHWKGAKEAVDAYFMEQNTSIFLNRVDSTCRLGIKM